MFAVLAFELAVLALTRDVHQIADRIETLLSTRFDVQDVSIHVVPRA